MGLINATQRKAKMTNASLRKANMTIAKKNGIEKCKFQKGENNKCKKTNANEKCKFEKRKKQLEKQMELNNASFRGAKLTIAKQMN